MRKKFLPGWMLEGNHLHRMAEFFKNPLMFQPFSFFRESQEIDLKFGSQGAQEMKRPMVRAAIERVGEVGIKDQ